MAAHDASPLRARSIFAFTRASASASIGRIAVGIPDLEFLRLADKDDAVLQARHVRSSRRECARGHFRRSAAIWVRAISAVASSSKLAEKNGSWSGQPLH